MSIREDVKKSIKEDTFEWALGLIITFLIVCFIVMMFFAIYLDHLNYLEYLKTVDPNYSHS